MTTLTCIALRTVKYSDRASILSVYTAQRGRMSLAVPAGKGKSAARFRALTMPMAVFECQADVRPGREIATARDVRGIVLPPSGSPVAIVQALFLADLLGGLLREPQADAPLFACLLHASESLAMAAGPSGAGSRASLMLPNFHLAFMLRLQRFMGIEPDWSTYRRGSVFDMAAGVFRALPPPHPHYLPPAEAEAAFSLSRMTPANCHLFRLSRHDRNTILDRLLSYYRLHFPTLPAITSTDILRQLFS